MEMELKDQARIVIESRHFVLFVQFAALTPFSMMIMPRRHMAGFSKITEEDADFLRRTRVPAQVAGKAEAAEVGNGRA